METRFCESDCIRPSGLGPVEHFVFGRRDVADRFKQPPVVEPVDPLQGGKLDWVDAPPWPAAPDDLGLEEPDDALRERVVVRVADRPDRGLDPRLGEPFGVANRQVLRSTIAVVDEFVAARARVKSLFQGVEGQVAPQRAGDAPTDDGPREDVDDERDVDEPGQVATYVMSATQSSFGRVA